MRRVAYLLRGGALPLPLSLTSGNWSWMGGGNHTHYTWLTLPHMWCALPLHVVRPPLLETPPLCYILEVLLPLQTRIGDLELCCCNASKLCGIEIKKTLEVILVVLCKCVDAHCSI
jgi:hypothetical protein